MTLFTSQKEKQYLLSHLQGQNSATFVTGETTRIGVNNSEKALEKSAKCFDMIINTDVVYLRKEKCYMYAYKWCFEEKKLNYFMISFIQTDI